MAQQDETGRAASIIASAEPLSLDQLASEETESREGGHTTIGIGDTLDWIDEAERNAELEELRDDTVRLLGVLTVVEREALDSRIGLKLDNGVLSTREKETPPGDRRHPRRRDEAGPAAHRGRAVAGPQRVRGCHLAPAGRLRTSSDRHPS